MGRLALHNGDLKTQESVITSVVDIQTLVYNFEEPWALVKQNICKPQTGCNPLCPQSILSVSLAD